MKNPFLLSAVLLESPIRSALAESEFTQLPMWLELATSLSPEV